MAQLTKRLCLPVGSYTPQGATAAKIEYREIGFMVEFEDGNGNKWNEVRLNLDALNPMLFQLARGPAGKDSSTARVKLFDVERKKKDATAPQGGQGAPAGGDDDDIPF